MRNSVLFCGRHKADNPAGSPSFQVLLLSLQVLDNSCNHLPLYRNPDHTLHQFNMLRGYAHLGMRIMILFQPVNYRLAQFLKLLCFTHSFSSPFFYSSLVVQSPYRTLPRPSTNVKFFHCSKRRKWQSRCKFYAGNLQQISRIR